MTATWPRVVPVGDRGLLVEFPPELSPETNALVRGTDAVLARLPGVIETVPAFRSVLLVYDPLAVTFDELVERAHAAARAARPPAEDIGPLIEVPVIYGGAYGPDLEAVAQSVGIPQAEVVRLHTEPTYRVYMLGFSPGFPYLGLLPAPLRLPRRASPRLRVPAGSVAIADAFAGIYPQETAGGWHVLGRTPLRLFDPSRADACLLRPGDRVRFVAVSGDPNPQAIRVDVSATPRRPMFEVLEAGLMTTVQDLGRRGHRRSGIPWSGPLDGGALRAANAAVGNDPGDAAIELTFPGPRLRVLEEGQMAIAGADLGARLDGTDIDHRTAIRVRPGDLIDFGAPRRGQWLYLGVAGGVDVPEALGSRATYARGGLGGIGGRSIRAGDILGVREERRERRVSRPGTMRASSAASPSDPVRVIVGPQAEACTVDALAAFFGLPFAVTVHRDRSGMRLRGPVLGHRGSAEILSDGLLPGAIQVPAGGDPLVILADGPTTGGYAKIASVIDADLDRLAQHSPGETVRFAGVTVMAAHALLRDQAREQAASW